MGVNDDRLSAGEQNELRALVTAGAGRMRAARRRRMQAITGGAAVVLVAAVVGAVALTAMGSPDRVATPIETTAPTPTPTPTPTEAPASARGVQPFGGVCANAITTDEVGEFFGVTMKPMAGAWADGSLAAQGGLSCTWSNDPGYGEQKLTMWAYPLSVVEPFLGGLEEASRCDAASNSCTLTGVRDGVWMSVSAVAVGQSGPDPAGLMDTAFQRATQWPSPAPAEPVDEWWPAVSCDDVTASVDVAGVLGAPVTVAVVSPPQGQSPSQIYPGEIPSRRGAVGGCTFTVGAGGNVSVRTISGGATNASDFASVSGASPLAVRGSYSAWTLPDDDPWEGHNKYVVVSDGVNLVRVGAPVDGASPSDDALGELGVRIIDALEEAVG
ncbi:hypothetical protein SK224_15340 [Microbacterium sp. BG28]|uniref:hypothetical protein n=1 Tax=Microbacterium sp. BG28 TaxID=3097356 RepID=UPI002A5A2EE5|nr:hypothetical protein [Microbacterium sp. BG28]MDY0830507.1 hypothetical protein [Microbacterium sp. BG28]